MNNTLVWRYQLFKPSEHFILNQTQMLKDYSPLLVGGKTFGTPQYPTPYRCLDSMGGAFLLGKSLEFQQLLTEFRPALIHAHFCIDASMLLGILRTRNIPLVVTCHGFDASVRRGQMLRSGKIPWIWHALHEKSLGKRADVFICVSDFIRRKMAERGYPEHKLKTHYIGIDTERIKPDGQANKFERPTVFSAARFTEKKGLEYLVEAFRKVRADCPDAELILAGDGPLRPRLERQIAELGLAKCVKLTGTLPHSNVLEMMRRAWLFCVPSITASNGDAEGLGMVFLEAQALKTPVVSTRSGGIPEAVRDGETGHLVEERNADALAEKITALLRDESARTTMGESARTHIEQRFDIRTQTTILESIYQGIA
ncbi:glycosyltransferase [Pontiella sp.]|uniref:glycosyltransferase n=1 Tax=Pontiella sp. TaxID=2837462 RepID=UPI0035671E59